MSGMFSHDKGKLATQSKAGVYLIYLPPFRRSTNQPPPCLQNSTHIQSIVEKTPEYKGILRKVN